MKKFLILKFAAFILFPNLSIIAQKSECEKPNILLICIDDLRTNLPRGVLNTIHPKKYIM